MLELILATLTVERVKSDLVRNFVRAGSGMDLPNLLKKHIHTNTQSDCVRLFPQPVSIVLQCRLFLTTVINGSTHTGSLRKIVACI